MSSRTSTSVAILGVAYGVGVGTGCFMVFFSGPASCGVSFVDALRVSGNALPFVIAVVLWIGVVTVISRGFFRSLTVTSRTPLVKVLYIGGAGAVVSATALLSAIAGPYRAVMSVPDSMSCSGDPFFVSALVASPLLLLAGCVVLMIALVARRRSVPSSGAEVLHNSEELRP